MIPPRVDPGGEPAIEATDLTKRFGSFTAVNRVSFTIGRGEIFGFLGSNGCGKSTTMKMLTGLLPATEGQAKLFGDLVDADDLATRKAWATCRRRSRSTASSRCGRISISTPGSSTCRRDRRQPGSSSRSIASACGSP